MAARNAIAMPGFLQNGVMIAISNLLFHKSFSPTQPARFCKFSRKKLGFFWISGV
jgi:hypothetical protein